MNKTYEVVVILPETLADDQINKVLKSFEKEVKTLKGTTSSASRMGRKLFARPLKNMTAGEYVLYNMDIDPLKVQSLLDRCKLNEDLFRVQVFNKPPVAPVSHALVEDE